MFWLVGTDIDHRPAPKKKSKVDVANTTDDSDGKPVVSANRANQMVCLSSFLSSFFFLLYFLLFFPLYFPLFFPLSSLLAPPLSSPYDF